jgi:hypothetical protein
MLNLDRLVVDILDIENILHIYYIDKSWTISSGYDFHFN